MIIIAIAAKRTVVKGTSGSPQANPKAVTTATAKGTIGPTQDSLRQMQAQPAPAAKGEHETKHRNGGGEQDDEDYLHESLHELVKNDKSKSPEKKPVVEEVR